jgi:putative phosphoesterase
VISDTHGLLRPEAQAALAGCELIVHAGDVGDPAILDRLREIAPVVAVRGNVDGGAWARALPVTETVEVSGITIHVLHDRNQLDLVPAAAGVRLVVYGHSHTPLIEDDAGVLFLNPGSAGPRRFRLPVSVARVSIDQGTISAEIIELDVADAR